MLAFTSAVLATLIASWVGLLTITISVNESLAATATRVRDKVQANEDADKAIEEYAKSVVAAEARPHVKIIAFDDSHKLIAGSRDRTRGSNVTGAVAALVGLTRQPVDAADGTFLVLPDYDWFTGLLFQFAMAIVAIIAVAAIAAWYIARRVANAAVIPLAAVTRALNDIAGGDFVPQPVIEQNEQLHDLTSAYNSVAFTLREATAERERSELQMRQFIADAGHELRTPLTVVMGYLDALRAGVVRDSEGVSRIYDTIAAESRRMKGVIERLIFLARLDREPQAVPVSVDIASLVDDVVGRMEKLNGERLIYKRDGSVPVLADPAELTEGIKNVVDNALKYAPQSSVEVSVGADDGIATVRIADRGPGMSSTDVEHAFDRFYRGQAREDAEGSGLGLAITKRAVERAGGAVDLQSQLGRGTTVTITLPVAVNG